MVENEGPDEDYDEMIYRNLPPPGSSENSSRTTTLTERSDNGLLEEDINRASSNVSSSNYKTKKPNQAKVPKLYIGEEERQRLLAQQEATNVFHKFVEGNLILKQGIWNVLERTKKMKLNILLVYHINIFIFINVLF